MKKKKDFSWVPLIVPSYTTLHLKMPVGPMGVKSWMPSKIVGVVKRLGPFLGRLNCASKVYPCKRLPNWDSSY